MAACRAHNPAALVRFQVSPTLADIRRQNKLQTSVENSTYAVDKLQTSVKTSTYAVDKLQTSVETSTLYSPHPTISCSVAWEAFLISSNGAGIWKKSN